MWLRVADVSKASTSERSPHGPHTSMEEIERGERGAKIEPQGPGESKASTPEWSSYSLQRLNQEIEKETKMKGEV